MSKKKIGIIIVVAAVLVAAAGGGAWYLKENSGGNSADKVYVESVASLTSSASGVQNRYSGVVEAQESWKVNKEAEREIKEVFVEEGDMVEEGDPLFEYDMDDVKAELKQAELDLEGMQNEITDAQTQITQLTKERNSASSDEKYQYTADIQEKENSIKQTEYNIESKKAEMEKKQETIDNAVVTSKLAGVVKSINNNSSNDIMSGDDSSYMTVLAVGDFRIKGTVSETNVQMLSEEQPVLLRSRVDEEQTWTGTISKIDTQNEESGNNEEGGVYYESGSGMEKATKYPFYVTLDSTEGLMMGQHLFIELDQGQTAEKEGIWLFEGYIVQEEETSYVWTADAGNKLEKRIVELGEYDENMGQYEILSGLTEEDLIAFPMEGLYEGVTAVTNAEEVDYTSPLYNQEGEEGGEGEEGMDSEEGEEAQMFEDGEVPSDGEMPIEDEFSGEEDSSSEDEFSEEEDSSIDDESQGDNGGGKLAQ